VSTPRGMGGGGYQPPVSFMVPVTPMVRRIIQVTGVIYLLSVVLYSALSLASFLGVWNTAVLTHSRVFANYEVWTLFTYGWLHDLGAQPLMALVATGLAAWGLSRLYASRWARQELFLFLLVCFGVVTLLQLVGFGATQHVLFNLMGLYFFGHLFEDRWGPRRFLFFWVLCIAGGGLLSAVMWHFTPGLAGEKVVGASAGVMGLLAAYAVYFPNQTALYGFVVPIKGKYFLYVAIMFDLISLMSGQPSAVFAHFGGIIVGLLLTTGYWRPGKLRGKFNKRPPSKKRPHLRVVRPADEPGKKDDDPPRYLH
jgi:membrane associated rhomboid family serine protease